jgi:HEAT repeat protein
VSNGEFENHLAALSSEHTEEVGPAMDWLVAHPEQARPRLAALVRAAADDQATRRAMEILARIGHSDDVAPLAAVLDLGRGSLSWAAAQALAVHPAVAARDALLAALEAPEEEVVSAAVVALGQRRDEVARAALEGLLDHPSAGVRFRVVRALAALGARGSMAALKRRRAVEPDGEVKAAIDEALRE